MQNSTCEANWIQLECKTTSTRFGGLLAPTRALHTIYARLSTLPCITHPYRAVGDGASITTHGANESSNPIP